MGGVSNPNDALPAVARRQNPRFTRAPAEPERAALLAEYLEGHPAIRRVYYPGLPSHPDHQVAQRLMSGFGGVVSFEIDGDFELTGRFIDRLRLPYIGPTLGGVESIVQQPAALYSLDRLERQAAGIKDNLVRYAVGIEDPEDIIADLQTGPGGREPHDRA